jgi:hypothetical protein
MWAEVTVLCNVHSLPAAGSIRIDAGVEILIYGLIHFTLSIQSVVVALHYDSIMSYYSP